MGSAWDRGSADLLEALDTPAIKTPSAVLTDLDLLEYIARKGRPMIVSTGMSTLEEVDQAVERILRHTDQLILLQCTSAYPSEFADINLRVMDTFAQRYGVLVGYSGHERGICGQRSGGDAGRVRRRAPLHQGSHAARGRIMPRRSSRSGCRSWCATFARSNWRWAQPEKRVVAVGGAGARAAGQERRRRPTHPGGQRRAAPTC